MQLSLHIVNDITDEEKADLNASLATLNEGQRGVFRELTNFLRQTDRGIHTLEGFAGVGKTYIIQLLIRYINKKYGITPMVTAPTNKAVRVLKKSMVGGDGKATYATIHSALGLRETISASGVVSFEPDPMVRIPMEKQRVLILDEASMLNDELFERLLVYVRKRILRIILVGDPCQIPPVGQRESVAFDVTRQQVLNISVSRLTEIVRQKVGNPVIGLTMMVRNNPLWNGPFATYLPQKRLLLNESPREGVEWFDARNQEDYSTVNELLFDWFTSNAFRDDSDYAKVIAWRNDVVDQYNDRIRAMIYGPDCKRIETNEKLIVNKPIMEGKEVLFTTNDELEVVKVEVAETDLPNGVMVNYYNTKVEFVEEDGQVSQHWISILHEDSVTAFNVLLNRLAEDAKSASTNRKGNPKALWARFYQTQRLFADVKYNYAITGHKSQGSTYKNALVVERDIILNRDVLERNRILYTAYSRASQYLAIMV